MSVIIKSIHIFFIIIKVYNLSYKERAVKNKLQYTIIINKDICILHKNPKNNYST